MQMMLQEIADAVAGELIGESEEVVTHVEFDTRKLTAGGLFVPLAGGRDGHDFVEQAKEQGAAAAFWSRSELPAGLPIIRVADPLEAMQQLAGYYLRQIAPKVTAITGSNGKTTTKDMTAAVLTQKYTTYKTQGNYNNNIGMPYTMLHMPETTEMLVLEMGMDHAGEISELSRIAQPDAAVITMIGEAHIENLGSRAGIAKAKMEVVDGLHKDGLLLVPDEPLLKPLLVGLTQTVQTYSLTHQTTLYGTVVASEKEKTTFGIYGEPLTFTIPVLGNYNVKNALAAYGIGKWFGLTVEEIQAGLAGFQLTQNRTEWVKAGNGADILSDVYNANPTAMGLVLDTVSALPSTGRKLAVLADMLELGPDSPQMHASMAEHLQPEIVEKVFLYGSEMQTLQTALEKRYPIGAVDWYPIDKKDQLIQAIQQELQAADIVVLKGSNGMGLSTVVDALINMK